MCVENIKKFAKIFQLISPLQYRDLISACEEQFFGKVLYVKATKGDVGVVQLANYMMNFQIHQPQQHS
jgi:hypothetical protein